MLGGKNKKKKGAVISVVCSAQKEREGDPFCLFLFLPHSFETFSLLLLLLQQQIAIPFRPFFLLLLFCRFKAVMTFMGYKKPFRPLPPFLPTPSRLLRQQQQLENEISPLSLLRANSLCVRELSAKSSQFRTYRKIIFIFHENLSGNSTGVKSFSASNMQEFRLLTFSFPLISIGLERGTPAY